jgi:hypothetical protein
MFRLSTIKLNQVNSNGLRFEANPIKCEIEIRAFGRIVVEVSNWFIVKVLYLAYRI